jgi:tripartite-type tricarboxylate transporter receptor subunit TctC
MLRRKFLFGSLATAAVTILATLSGHAAWSQTTKPIKLVVPYPPGGFGDILARLLAEQIGRARGPTMVIENRAGAATVIGTEAVAYAASDGNTLLITGNSSFLINPHLRKLNYDPLASFEPICDIASVPTAIVVNSASPYRTLDDLLNAARAKPAELTLAGGAPASAGHLTFEMLKRAANVNMTMVPYPGNAPAVNALLGEHVTAVLADYPVLAEQLNAGKLRALATASRTRVELMPDVPTIAESGYKDIAMDSWLGLLAPAKTPRETVTRIEGWITAALQAPEFKAKLVVQGFNPVGMCGADFGALLRKQYDDWGRVIREANIKVE